MKLFLNFLSYFFILSSLIELLIAKEDNFLTSLFKPSPECPSTYFKCGDGTCVSFLFLCDGEADCENGSDELCNGTTHINQKLTCGEGKFSCPGIDVCLPNKWLCDSHRDCPDGFDEKNCTTPAKCDGFRCKSGECIPSKWKCDLNPDCADGSDEENCKSTRINKNCIRENGRFECASGLCISHEKLCNGKKDCPGGDDEGKFCDIDGCHSKNCTHGCFQTPTGAQCDCNDGFKLDTDSRTCIDIDECNESKIDICSQKCINTKGSFQCTCESGFRLVNQTKCVVESAEPILIYTDAQNIRGYWLNSKSNVLIARGLDQTTGVDMHRDSKLVFWTDIGKNASFVFSAHFHNKDVKAVVTTGLIFPEDIAVDYVANNIYITDAGLKQIIVCRMDGSSCSPIVTKNIDTIRAITLDVQNGRMFWSDWGSKPGIYTARMDGSQMRAIVNRNIMWPNGITYDRYKNRVYWSDAKLERIEYFDLNINKRFVLIDDAVYHPHCLTIFEDKLYWADWESFNIASSNKFTGHNMTTVLRRTNKVFGMHIYHPVHYSTSSNPCWAASCSHICLLVSSSEFRCACPNNMELDPKDHTTCIEKDDSSYLLVGLDETVKKVWPKNIAKDITKKILDNLPKGIDQINDYTYSHHNNIIYLHSQQKSGIFKYNILSKEYKLIHSDNTTSVFALTYDDYSDNLYWLDTEKGSLNVGSSDGKHKITLLEKLQNPSSIALYQERNELFISLMGKNSLIMVTDLDGKNSKVLIDNLGLPTSLAICKEKNLLYWSDAHKGTIESISIDDQNVKSTILNGLGHVESLVIKDQMLYWTNQESSYLSMLDLNDENKRIMIASVGTKANISKKLSIVHNDITTNDCLTIKNKCSDICLFNGFKTINNVKVPLSHCVCSIDSTLAEDRRTCEVKKHCPDGFFTCASTKQCIRQSEVCDGHKNCDNNEDEIGCPEIQPCKEFESRCNPKDLKSTCIPNSWFCDGESDCENDLDELNCHNFTGKTVYEDVAHKSVVNGKCDAGYFKCDQDKCIPWHFVCNGELNCYDHTDEGPNCLSKCSCKNNGKCYLDQDNIWQCQCSHEFEGRECEFRVNLDARSNDAHHIVMKESIYSKGQIMNEEYSNTNEAISFWMIMFIVAIVLIIVGFILIGFMYMYETDGRLYMIKRNLNRKLNFRNNSFRKTYDFNSATVDLLDRMECEADEEETQPKQSKDNQDQFVC